MKKIIKILLAIWLGGAIGMSIYYDIERKSTCIRQEGFWKGWLWCSTDPKTSFELSFQRMYFLLKGLAWPITIFLVEKEQVEASQQHVWSAQRNETRIVVEKKGESGDSLYSILLVSYNPTIRCRPELSFLEVKGQKLGEPIRQDRLASILTLAVGKSQLTEHKAVKTEYSNGFELAIELDGETISKMQRGQFVEVGTGGYVPSTTFPLEQFSVSMESARISCAKM